MQNSQYFKLQKQQTLLSLLQASQMELKINKCIILAFSLIDTIHRSCAFNTQEREPLITLIHKNQCRNQPMQKLHCTLGLQKLYIHIYYSTFRTHNSNHRREAEGSILKASSADSLILLLSSCISKTVDHKQDNLLYQVNLM